MNSYLLKSWINMWYLKEKLRESSTAAQVKSNPRVLRKLDRFRAVGDWNPNYSDMIVFSRLIKRELKGNSNSLWSWGKGPSCLYVPEKEERHAQTHRQHTHACTHLPLMFPYISLLKVLNPWAISWGPFSFLLNWKSSILGFHKQGVGEKIY